jgi:hypothetical protein
VLKTRIPATIEEASRTLAGLDRLVTATEWERAAIVYAFTDPVVGNQVRRTAGLSIEQFARLGIVGLKSPNSVRLYRTRWQAAINEGAAVPVRPGDDVELPDISWMWVRTLADRKQLPPTRAAWRLPRKNRSTHDVASRGNTWDRLMMSAGREIRAALDKRRAGTWVPSPEIEALMTSLAYELATREHTEVSTKTFDDIEEYLRKEAVK